MKKNKKQIKKEIKIVKSKKDGNIVVSQPAAVKNYAQDQRLKELEAQISGLIKQVNSVDSKVWKPSKQLEMIASRYLNPKANGSAWNVFDLANCGMLIDGLDRDEGLVPLLFVCRGTIDVEDGIFWAKPQISRENNLELELVVAHGHSTTPDAFASVTYEGYVMGRGIVGQATEIYIDTGYVKANFFGASDSDGGQFQSGSSNRAAKDSAQATNTYAELLDERDNQQSRDAKTGITRRFGKMDLGAVDLTDATLFPADNFYMEGTSDTTIRLPYIYGSGFTAGTPIEFESAIYAFARIDKSDNCVPRIRVPEYSSKSDDWLTAIDRTTSLDADGHSFPNPIAWIHKASGLVLKGISVVKKITK